MPDQKAEKRKSDRSFEQNKEVKKQGEDNFHQNQGAQKTESYHSPAEADDLKRKGKQKQTEQNMEGKKEEKNSRQQSLEMPGTTETNECILTAGRIMERSAGHIGLEVQSVQRRQRSVRRFGKGV